MKRIFTDVRARARRDLRELGFAGDLNFADCAATLLPWGEALEQPFRIVFAGPAAGTISSAATRRGARRRQPAVRRRRRDLDRRLADRRRPAVRQQHVRPRARPGDQRALGRDLERRRGWRQHRRDLSLRRRHRRPGERRLGPGPGLLRSRRHRADPLGRLPADGDPRPGRLRRRARCGSTPSSRAKAFEALPTPLRFERPRRLRVPDRGGEHRRGGDERRRPPRRRPARLHARRVRRCRADAASGGARPASGAPHHRPAAPGSLLRDRAAQHRPRLLRAAAARTSCLLPTPRRQIAACSSEMEAQLARAIPEGAEATVRRSFDGRLMGQSWETPFVELPEGPIDDGDDRAGWSSASTSSTSAATAIASTFVPVQGVTYRVQLIVPSEKVEYDAARDAAPRRAVEPDRTRELRYFDEDPLRGRASTARDRLPVGARHRRARRSSARTCRRRSSARARWPRSAASARS